MFSSTNKMEAISSESNCLYVDPSNHKTFRNIQDAINVAQPGTRIKVVTGYYPNFVINKPGITIEPAGNLENVVILADSAQTVRIEFDGMSPAVLIGLKFGHTAVESKINYQKMIKILLSKKKTNLKSNESLDTNFSEYYQSDPNQIALLRVVKGEVICHKCLFSYKLLAKSLEYLISAIILEENTRTVMKNCEIAGNKNYSTCGILINKADLEMEDCKVYNHGYGGISVFLQNNNRFDCKGNMIFKNKLSGIDLSCREGTVTITGNIILGNDGFGVRCGIKTKALITKNKISNNTTGICLVSSEANILKNVIKGCEQFGILSTTKDSFDNRSEIKLNSITENKLSGIVIEGANNATLVQSNFKIAHNLECGVLVRKQAFPEIVNNSIYANIHQGVLIQEDAAAKIIQNNIYKNIKANIALGGVSNDKSVIIYNTLYSSSAEGIFCMKTGTLAIHNNDIFSNYEGIILSESHADVKANTIHENLINGILVMDGSNPAINNNIIEKNEAVGLLVKDSSEPKVESNRITDNEINIACENKHLTHAIWDFNQNNGQHNDLFIKHRFCIIF